MGRPHRRSRSGFREPKVSTLPLETCQTGKLAYRDHSTLVGSAGRIARELNAVGQFVVDLYAYRCGSCRHWHFTSMPEYRGYSNELVFKAASHELQLWAMPNGPRAETEDGLSPA